MGEPTFGLRKSDHAARLKQVVEGINNHRDVDALCRSFPALCRASLLSVLRFWSEGRVRD